MSDKEQMAGPGEPEAGDGLAPEVIGISGELTLRHIRGGKVIDEQTLPNIVVNSGLQHFARLLIQDPNDPNRTRGAFYIQIGTGAIGPHPTDPSATIVIPPQATDTALYQYFSQSGTKINVPGDGGGDDEAPRRMRIQEERGKKGDPDYVPFTTKEMVDEAHAHGMVVIPWTINDKPTMRKLIDDGVDGLITDYPNRLREVAAEYGFKLPKPVRPAR